MWVRGIQGPQMHWNAPGMHRIQRNSTEFKGIQLNSKEFNGIQRNSTEFNPNSLLYMGFVSFIDVVDWEVDWADVESMVDWEVDAKVES